MEIAWQGTCRHTSAVALLWTLGEHSDFLKWILPRRRRHFVIERHLWDWPAVATAQGRWRILMADDHGPHKADAVRELAWHHGDVLIIHGGGRPQ